MKNGTNEQLTFDQLLDWVIDVTHVQRTAANTAELDDKFGRCVRVLSNPYLTLRTCQVIIEQILEV